MYQYVALVQDSTIIEFTDTIDYALVSYSPGVPFHNDNELGPLYARVTDTITFHAIACTAAQAYAVAAAVNGLLDQAWRWANGEPVSAVRLQIQAQDSALALPLEAVIEGRAPGSAPALALPEQWPELAGKYVIPNITIQFVRHGELLYPTAETGSSTASPNPTVQSIAIATPTTISSPTSLACSFYQGGILNVGAMTIGLMLTASAAARLQIYEAETATLGTNVTSVADAAALARGGSVARYAPGVLASSISISLAGFDTAARMVAVYAAVRPNTAATTNWTIQAQILTGGTAAVVGPLVPIDASVLTPRIVFLGILRARRAIDVLTLLLTASAAANTLDIDYVVIQAIDDETSGALTVLTSTSGAAGGATITSDTEILSEPTALVTLTNGPLTTPIGYSGNPIFYTRGSFVATLLACDGALWRVADGVTLQDTLWSATRYGAYLVPR